MSALSSKARFSDVAFNEEHHVCAFFRSKDEEFRTLKPFIVDGLAAGEKAIHIINVNLREGHRRRLIEVGVDVDAVERSGQMEVLSWPTIPQHGLINQDEAIELIDHALTAADESGYPRTRVIGDMDWAVEDHILDGELIALE